MVLVVSRLAEDSAEEGAVSESEAGSVSYLTQNSVSKHSQAQHTHLTW